MQREICRDCRDPQRRDCVARGECCFQTIAQPARLRVLAVVRRIHVFIDEALARQRAGDLEQRGIVIRHFSGFQQREPARGEKLLDLGIRHDRARHDRREQWLVQSCEAGLSKQLGGGEPHRPRRCGARDKFAGRSVADGADRAARNDARRAPALLQRALKVAAQIGIVTAHRHRWRRR